MNSQATPLNGFDSRLISFEQVREAVQADDGGKWDMSVSRHDIAFRNGQVAFPLDANSEHWEYLTPTTWATGQLCARLGIPAGYFRKCPPILQDQQANYWLKSGCARSLTGSTQNGVSQNAQQDDAEAATSTGSASDERWLLRARYGSLRAVLSNRYSPLDNAMLLECLQPLLKSRYRTDWLALGEESLHLRIVDPARFRELLPGDPLTVGIHLSNSEVGFRAVSVDALVYRLVCTNGLIRLVKGKSLLRQRHIHIAQPRFVSALEEAIEAALLEADGFIEQLKSTTSQPIGDIEDTLKHLGEKWSLSQTTQETMKASLLNEAAGQQETVYGLVNAFTSAAQRLPDEERYDLEILAGRLVEQGLPLHFQNRSSQPQSVASPPARNSEPEPLVLPEPLAAALAKDEVPLGSIPDDESEEDGIPFSAVAFAQELFEAEIVGVAVHQNAPPESRLREAVSSHVE